ncbi:protein arginine kinase [Akkermansiaceae bacterium]|nr:protein arginine kinase [Akkermansiaceae bacterium]
MRFATLLKNPADWMEAKNIDNSIVVSSRVRLARNVSGYAFPGWSEKKQRVELTDKICQSLETLGVMKNGFSHEFSDLSQLQKQVLVERHLISRELAARGEGAAAVIDRKQRISIMVNEEDHLRMQSIYAGLNIKKAYKVLSKVDTDLETKLTFAFDKDLGYITACPTNLGTGMRASAMLHLPGLSMSGQLSKVLNGISKIGLAVRGIFGEGTESIGYLFQISNQSTLGESEESIIDRLDTVLYQVMQHEQNAREKNLQDNSQKVIDEIGRSYGLLKYSHLMDSKEAYKHVSIVRLGAATGFFDPNIIKACDNWLLDIQPAHLQLHAKKELDSNERDFIRAEILRDKLQNVDSPSTNYKRPSKKTNQSDDTPSLFEDYE